MVSRRGDDIYLDVTPDVKPRLESKGCPKRRRCLDLIVKALFCFGFWPAEGRERRGALFYWRYFYPRIQFIRMTYSIIVQAVNVSLVWGDLPLMAEYVIMILMYSMAFLKLTTLFFYQDQIQKMVSILETLSSSLNTSDTYLKTFLAKTNRFSDYFSIYAIIWVSVSSCAMSIALIIQGFIKHTIPFRRWFPHDTQSSPAFEITLVSNYLLVPFDMSLVILCDVLFITINVHIIAQFQVLAHKLSHVRADVETSEKMKENTALLSGSLVRYLGPRPVMAPFHPRVAKRTVSVEHKTRFTGTKSPTKTEIGWVETSLAINTENEMVEQTRVIVINKEREKSLGKLEVKEAGVTSEGVVTENTTDIKKTNQQIERYLRHCIIKHQQLIRLCSQFGSVFKIMLPFQIVCNIACGLVVLYITTLARYVDAKTVSFLICACTCYLEYFFFCWYGNRITEESVNVRDAIYDCDWFGASESFKRSMRIVILRTNKPIIIRAGGLPLSMRTFKKIYKASYYLNMLLGKLFHGEKII